MTLRQDQPRQPGRIELRERRSSSARPRVAVVLGAAVWSGGRPSPTLARRADHAIALYHTGQIDAILGCGGLGKHPPTEAQVIGDLCRASGIPDSVLHTEDRSMTTRENLLNALPMSGSIFCSFRSGCVCTKDMAVTRPEQPRCCARARQSQASSPLAKHRAICFGSPPIRLNT